MPYCSGAPIRATPARGPARRVGSVAVAVAALAMLAGSAASVSWVSAAPAAPPQPGPSSPPPWLTTSSAADPATAAFDRFLAVYWSPRHGFFYARSDHRARAGGSLVADFWWTAQLWQLVMDSYEHGHRASDRALVDRVYDGFIARNPTFSSDFNDDRGWWALAATRAYELTGERRFLVRAESLFDGIWRSWDTHYGGGIWWRRSTHDQKNMATNAPAVVTAIRLYRATGDPRYRSRAIAIFRWLDTRLRSGTEVDDHVEGAGNTVGWQFTYNYGAYLDAAAELGRLAHSATYLARATAAAEHGIADLVSDGVLRDEGTGDAGGFKGIFVRNLAAFARATGQTRFLEFLASNARVASANARSDSLWGPAWNRPPRAGPIESLTDHSAVALFLVAPLVPVGVKAASITPSASMAPASIARSSLAPAAGPAESLSTDALPGAGTQPVDPGLAIGAALSVALESVFVAVTVPVATTFPSSRGRPAIEGRAPYGP